MKTSKTKCCLLLLFSLLSVLSKPALAQEESTRLIIQSAMRDEMARNMNRLELERLERPFYIGYTIRDAKTMEVTATLGAIVRSDQNRYRNHTVPVMVGDYSLNDENFLDVSGGSYRRTLLRGADRLPLEDDYNVAAVQINASTQAVDGEPLSDHLLYYGWVPQDLPSLDSVRGAVKSMAEELVALRTAPVFEESYTGPVMFEGLGPSVISVTSSEGMSQAEMKGALLQLARDEGLDYAILVRKLKSPVSGAGERLDPMAMLTMARRAQQGPSLSEPILAYGLWVEDGREELVRSVELGTLPLSSLRRMAGAAQRQMVYNTLVPGRRRVSNQGIQASFIVPQSLIFEELEVENEKRSYTPKLPVVPSPLLQK